MWTDVLTSNQAYEIGKNRSDWSNNTRRDAEALKEATAARHAAKVEGSLALVEEAKVPFRVLSDPVDVAKLKVDYLESMKYHRK